MTKSARKKKKKVVKKQGRDWDNLWEYSLRKTERMCERWQEREIESTFGLGVTEEGMRADTWPSLIHSLWGTGLQQTPDIVRSCITC